MIRKSKNKCSLLPYIRENVYGLSTSSGQFIGWEIKKFNIENQWKHSTGKGVTVAVIDTGCDIDHPDIKNNIVQGKNFIEKDKDPIDRNGHGTHVAGTIAAENNGIGMVGVAPDAKIMPVKALKDDGSGDIQTVVSAILWSVDNNADLITMSLGSPNPHPDLESAINYAASKGVIIFCAAGNSGEQTDIMYPAKFNHTIAIGAIDKDLKRTEFTCSGETLDFLAPGHEILSCVPGGNYASMSGTSMSNPFAVGCAALFLSYARYIKYSAQSEMLNSTEDYIKVFKNKTKHLADPKYSGIKKYEGYGILYPVL
jgi:subtilisin family serine protease